MDLLTNYEYRLLKDIINDKDKSITPPIILYKFFINDYIKLTKKALDTFSEKENTEGFYKWISEKGKEQVNIGLGPSFAELTFKGLWLMFLYQQPHFKQYYE